MDTNKLIEEALKQGNKMLGGIDLFVLEAHPERNDLRVLTIDKMYQNNIMAFMYNINHGYIPLGIFTSEEAAEEMVITVRTLFRDEQGERLM